MKNRALDLLKFQAFPELAVAVRQRCGSVIERWQAAVRQTLPAAHELTIAQVRNSLPDTLEQLAQALEANEPHATKELMDVSTSHGEARYDQNYNLSELMIEYGLLRPILIEETTAHLGRVIGVEEIVALNLGVDIACRRGVTRFVNAQRAELGALVEAQSKYLAFLSHDLRGGLNGVLLMIEVLRRDLSTEPKFAESLNDLDVMRRSILDTVATMERFLHAERFRNGKVQVKPATVSVAGLVNDVANQFRYHAGDKGLQIQAQTSKDFQIVSDRELLSMILQNVVGNAVKYSRGGTVRIMAGPDGPGHAARISVADQGPGIAPEKLTELFQSYMRGETHGQVGTGLGLSIARQAADLLGAKLWAESTEGQGSTFHLDLPAAPPGSG
jgi:signal transduction histidine kinase